MYNLFAFIYFLFYIYLFIYLFIYCGKNIYIEDRKASEGGEKKKHRGWSLTDHDLYRMFYMSST